MNCVHKIENGIEMDIDGIDIDLDMEFDTGERSGTPVELIEASDEAAKDILPLVSGLRYQQVYNNFQKWKTSKMQFQTLKELLLHISLKWLQIVYRRRCGHVSPC